MCTQGEDGGTPDPSASRTLPEARTQNSRFRNFTEVATAWIQVIALVGAGTWGIFEYLNEKEVYRINQNIRFVDLYFSNQVLQARQRIEIHWKNSWPKVERGLMKVAASERRAEFERLTDQQIKKSTVTTLRSDIMIMMTFYESLLVCISEKICDERTAHNFFGDGAVRFFVLNRSYIKKEIGSNKFSTSPIQWLHIEGKQGRTTEA